MHHARKRKRHSRRRLLWLLTECACAVLAIILVITVVHRLWAENHILQEEQQSAELMETLEAIPEPEPAAQNAAPQIQSGFEELLSQNADFRGVLNFASTHSLYVCQAADNLYYMDHQFDGAENPAGMIYMDYRNALSPRSDNLILYGHNMRNGSRFGTLGRYTDSGYLLANPVFTFADLYETVEYIPFAIFHTTVLSDDPSYFAFDQTDFADETAFQAYVNAVRERSVLDLPAEVRYGDRLLTLATCSSAHERGRLVIVCREKQN